MGTGKTTKAIKNLKQYLASKYSQNIEVYVPRHDLANEWEQGLDGINAEVVYIYPRRGGKWDESSWSYPWHLSVEVWASGVALRSISVACWSLGRL